jgi:hypothetical protein
VGFQNFQSLNLRSFKRHCSSEWFLLMQWNFQR